MFPEICEILSNGGTITCFLTDADGVPVDTDAPLDLCEAVRRVTIPVTLPNGVVADLQQVTLRKSGFVVLEVTDGETTCLSEPISFCSVENIILCAPDGTDIVCEVTDFSCSPCVSCNTEGFVQSIDIFFRICQNVQVVADVTVELTTRLCQPRQAFDVPLCPRNAAIPPQCPVLFPDAGDMPATSVPEPPAISLPAPEPVVNQAELETICVNTSKVYDWIVLTNDFEINRLADDLIFNCTPCEMRLFVPAVTLCERIYSGKLLCGEDPVAGAAVNITADPPILEIDPDPVITDEFGNFEVLASVASGTDDTMVTVTAFAELPEGLASKSLNTMAFCPEPPCSIDLFIEGQEDLISCSSFLSGRVRCGNTVIEGATVDLESSNPAIIMFESTPATTGSNGNYFAGISIPENTPVQEVTITATTTIDGETLTASVDITVECNETPCP
ncbi:hypothetical protein QRD89_18550 [Halobacillus sp. ACCC02827]|uniref:hypothetical protein n=1 Tax=Halobacillus sp. ACCC02827 TaxID=3052090 RepID=UPI00256FDA01|nr:hypothetical protein [Halobacillus sp. ACCC02827]WJE15696.1 hypothetical protein QRD89_18550 [Halobacillus sp. ACCC02827]